MDGPFTPPHPHLPVIKFRAILEAAWAETVLLREACHLVGISVE